VLKHIKNTPEWEEKSLGAKGFTLIELLVVIVILGILAAVVVFAVNGITDKGSVSACKTEARTIKTAVQAYNAQYAAYPTSLAQLTGSFLEKAPENVTLSAFSATAAPNLAWNTTGKSDCNPAKHTDLGATP